MGAADWDFDDPAWDDISDLAKDFICRLMVKDKRWGQVCVMEIEYLWSEYGNSVINVENDLHVL